MRRSLAPVLLFLLATVLVSPLAAAVEDDDYERIYGEYRAYQRRPSLFMRTRGRRRLAQTRDPRALEVLARSYAQPERPEDQVRYLLAWLGTKHFDEARHVDALVAWRERHQEPQDAWLWYRTLLVQTRLCGPEAALAIARGHEEPFLRAAALEALAECGEPAGLPLVTELLADLPRSPLPRALLVEGAASILASQASRRESPEFQEAAEALIAQLEDKHTLPRTRLVIARHLARVVGSDDVHFDAGVWRLEMRSGRVGAVRPGSRYAQPRPTFIGVQGAGRRIAYVIDASDSMLQPLTDAEKRDLRPPRVVTPRGGRPDRRASTGPPPLPWDRIHNRFDAAREFLKRSIESLPKDAAFTVILFGSEAEPLDATPGLMKATKARKRLAIRELDDIAPGRPEPRRPHGTLRGFTNLHGGLHRAFKAQKNGLVRGPEYVDPKTFESGCDTIFVLSDGRPTWDDWPEWDAPEAEDRAGDPESADPMAEAPSLHFAGAYFEPDTLVTDECRLNLFRRVDIHCVGIGEADPMLLREMAAHGHGRLQLVGHDIRAR